MTNPGRNESGKLRLCFISNPNLIHTRRWVSWFARRGHSVHLLADVAPRQPSSEVPLTDLSKVFYAPIIRFPVWAAWLRRFLATWQPDVLHAHRVNSAGWLAAASGFHPYVVTPWGTDVNQQPQRSRVARWLAHYTLGRADMVTTLSESMREVVLELGGRTERLRAVHFGVEMDIFHPGSTSDLEREEAYRRFSLPAGARVVLSPRAITPVYNQDIVLQAIPLVRERFAQAVFLFIDYNTDRDYKKQLESMVADLGCEACVRWLPAMRNREQMAQLYRLSEVVVSVPLTDGMPVSVLEAMACGRAVVCSDLEPLREFIRPGENGLLVPTRKHIPLAEAINRLLEQPGKAQEFGQLAYREVAQRANYEVEMQRMEGYYYELAGRKGV